MNQSREVNRFELAITLNRLRRAPYQARIRARSQLGHRGSRVFVQGHANYTKLATRGGSRDAALVRSSSLAGPLFTPGYEGEEAGSDHPSTAGKLAGWMEAVTRA